MIVVYMKVFTERNDFPMKACSLRTLFFYTL